MGSKPLRKYKLVFIGDQSVGKTSIVGEHVHIDHRPPNGGGRLAAKCGDEFPTPPQSKDQT